MATYQEQLAKTRSASKERAIQDILEGIYAGKWFGREALSRAYDAGVQSTGGAPLPSPNADEQQGGEG